jgi:hypothetical protein
MVKNYLELTRAPNISAYFHHKVSLKAWNPLFHPTYWHRNERHCVESPNCYILGTWYNNNCLNQWGRTSFSDTKLTLCIRLKLGKYAHWFGAACWCKKSITVPVGWGSRGKQEFWCVARVKVICNRVRWGGGGSVMLGSVLYCCNKNCRLTCGVLSKYLLYRAINTSSPHVCHLQ